MIVIYKNVLLINDCHLGYIKKFYLKHAVCVHLRYETFGSNFFSFFKFIFDTNEKKSFAILGSNFKPANFLSESSLRNVVAEQRCCNQCFFPWRNFAIFRQKKLGNFFFQVSIQLILLILGQISPKKNYTQFFKLKLLLN